MIKIMNQTNIWKRIRSNHRIIIISLAIVFMIIIIIMIYSPNSGLVNNGRVDLSRTLSNQKEFIELDGYWEFYWDRLLTSEDFNAEPLPQMDSLIKVPGSWDDRQAQTRVYPIHGIATYRMIVKYPSAIEDPALRIKTVSAAYKLYANGKFITEVGKVSGKHSEYEGDFKQIIVDLPNDKKDIELIFQVANLNYIRGGLRDSMTFGSKQALEEHKMFLMAIQLLFIGGILGLGLYYFVLFVLQRKNKTDLFFSILCLITASRAFVWGETPLMIICPNIPIQAGLFLNYITAYNLIPVIILFVISIYPLDYKKKTLAFILLPTLFFEALLLAPAGFRASFNIYYYTLMLVQMIYAIGILIKAVLRKRDSAELMLMAIEVFILTMIADRIAYKGFGISNLSYMFLYGNFAVIIAMPYILAKQKALTFQTLIWHNENLEKTVKERTKELSKANERLRIEHEKINYIAHHDALTGLPNRRMFKKKMENALELACRSENMLALFYLDLDGFKIINDTKGHAMGDQLLVEVSERLTHELGKSDTVMRLGGDEFAIIIENIENLDLIKVISEKIRNCFQRPFYLNNMHCFITGSIGIAVYPMDGMDAESLLKKADIAMYEAKDKVKNL